MFQGSTHQAAGLACADCHMPYRVEGSEKVSSHWWTSPLKTIEQSCGTCHREDPQWLKERVLYTQDKTYGLLRTAGQANARAIQAIAKAAQAPGVDNKALEEARELQRQAQWYWDWVSAENSMGFHNPQLAMETLSRAINLARQAELKALRAEVRG